MEQEVTFNKNPIFIKSVHLKNFRTYKDLKINFRENIQVLVGPNESGKTNLLRSFKLFDNPELLLTNDTCCFSKDITNTYPEISFRLNWTSLGLIELDKTDFLRFYKGEYGIFKSDGTSVDITNIGKNNNESLGFIVDITSKMSSGNIHLTIPEINKYANLPGSHLSANQHLNFIATPDEAKNILAYLKSHQERNNIEFDIRPQTSLWGHIPDIINWKFDQGYYIPNELPLQKIIDKPVDHKSLQNMFKIAGIDIKELIKITDATRKRNLLTTINKKISEILNQTWTQYQDIELHLSIDNNILHIDFLENGRYIHPTSRSLGFQWFFAFILYFNANFGNDLRGYVILLDEPGIHLHPGGQKDLLNEIEKLAVYNQIIYTTHLPFMINRMYPERIIPLNKENGITFITEPRKEGIFDSELISSILGYNYSSLSRWGEINVFVEGITDKILFEKLIYENLRINKEIILDLNHFSFIPINGVNNIANFIRVAQETATRYLVFIDNDKEAKDYTKKYFNNPDKHQRADEHILFLDENSITEDYIPIDIVNSALTSIKHKDSSIERRIGDFQFKDKINMSKQLNDIINQINQNKQESEEKVEKGPFKLDLMLEVKKLINGENVNQFKLLIEKICLLNERTNKLYSK